MRLVLTAACVAVLVVLLVTLLDWRHHRSQSAWQPAAPLPTRVYSIRRPDDPLAVRDEVTAALSRLIEVDTRLPVDALGSRQPVIQLTYLLSYEQMGVVRVACHAGCACEPTTVDTLAPNRRFATLNTVLSGAVSRAEHCVLRVSNESPRPSSDGAPARGKIKLVSLAVLSSARSGVL